MNKKKIVIILLVALMVILCCVGALFIMKYIAKRAFIKNISDRWMTTAVIDENILGDMKNSEIKDYFDFKDANIEVSLIISEDGNCELTVNETKLDIWTERIRTFSKTALREHFEDELEDDLRDENISEEEFYKYMEVAGLEEYIEKTLGKNLDEYVDEMLDDVISDIYSYTEKLQKSGTYTLEKDKVLMMFGEEKQTFAYDAVSDSIILSGDEEIIMHREK
ncbi:MAG: hypothetical protein K6D96_06030 [Acetatifactor sp.]|nr:hypothetical protein [Acetatifactor sp.]